MNASNTPTPFISVVLPVFNEQGSLPKLYQKIHQVMTAQRYRYELIFVDDGSDDSSFQILSAYQQHDKTIKLIQFRKNFGKSAAYHAGFSAAHGDIVITLDADLQDDPEEIPLFIDKIQQGFDMVVGWRYTRKDNWHKKIPSRFFNHVVAKLTRIPLHDFNCPFKAYSRDVLREIEIYGEQHRYIPVLAQAKGFSITEIKIENKPRLYGYSKYGVERLLRGMLDLFTVIFITRFSKRPLHLLGAGGAIVCSIGGLILLSLTAAHFLFQLGILTDSSWNMHDRPVLSLGILLMIVGVQFFSIGLLGELMINLQGQKQNENKGYSIKQVLTANDDQSDTKS